MKHEDMMPGKLYLAGQVDLPKQPRNRVPRRSMKQLMNANPSTYTLVEKARVFNYLNR